jgi:SAM-dependent methyltransferase
VGPEPRRSSSGRERRGPRAAEADPPTPSLSAIERARGVDEYRAGREWRRYEGTAQRELFRTLRERFLARHGAASGRVLDIGAGPGRFTPFVGTGSVQRVAIDLALPMLHGLRQHWPTATDRPEILRADGRSAPFRPRSFSEVVVLGNAIGFAGDDAFPLLDAAAELVGPGGRLIVETAPGPGTVSRYLRRLPSGAMVRLLRAPLAAVAPRATREGYEVFEREDRTRHGFRPVSDADLTERLTSLGFAVRESVAVAPALGGLPERLEDVRADSASWQRLIALEERLGSSAKARLEASALLLAGERDPGSADRSVK